MAGTNSRAGGLFSPAASDLGLGDNLQQQQIDETEEEKKRRKMLGLAQGGTFSPAVSQLFGVGGSGGAGF